MKKGTNRSSFPNVFYLPPSDKRQSQDTSISLQRNYKMATDVTGIPAPNIVC